MATIQKRTSMEGEASFRAIVRIKGYANLSRRSTLTAGATSAAGSSSGAGTETPQERLPTRFMGTVMISADRPARDIHQIVEAIVEQLTTIPGSDVTLRLEIDAEVSQGLDRSAASLIGLLPGFLRNPASLPNRRWRM